MLELVDRTVRYDGRVALDRVSLHIDDGERVAVCGPNGAGKSTLLRALAGPGAVFVPQQTPEDLALTARAFVMLGRTAHLSPWRRPAPADHAAVARALVDVGAAHLADRRLDAVSGGERRRLAVALALASGAPHLLLDEPGAQLDFVQRRALQALLASLDRTVVATVHELPFGSTCFTRVVLMSCGRIVADGAPADVLVPDRLAAAWQCAVSALPEILPPRA